MVIRGIEWQSFLATDPFKSCHKSTRTRNLCWCWYFGVKKTQKLTIQKGFFTDPKPMSEAL
jgi:hypothetical protein